MMLMSRAKKDVEVMRSMCTRFSTAMGNLQMSSAELARALGYSNSATLSKVQRGEAFVDVERLYRLAQLEAPGGQKVDLHWLITGTKYPEENKA